MVREEAKTEYIHLTKEQVTHTLEGLNLLMRQHYNEYEDDLPEHFIQIINVFTEVRSKFKYCHACRNYFYQRWSSNDCGCPESKEEEE